jgi:hypothetical protein
MIVVRRGCGTGLWECLAAEEAHDAGSGSESTCSPYAAVAGEHSPATTASAAAVSRMSVSTMALVAVGFHPSPPSPRYLCAAPASARASVLVVCADSTSGGAHCGFAPGLRLADV